MKSGAAFYGIGVGPGPADFLPLAAVKALQKADVIVAPRAKNAETSVARQCIVELALPEEKFREIVFDMDPDRNQAKDLYDSVARTIVDDLNDGKTVAYLTIGDTMTFSTYGYLLEKLERLAPEAELHTFPGITSYAAIAARAGWPLGQGKERVLVLPCPDNADELRAALESNDLVVLMKIGRRMTMVSEAIDRRRYECVVGQKIGLPGEVFSDNLDDFLSKGGAGYLTTMLIRRKRRTE